MKIVWKIGRKIYSVIEAQEFVKFVKRNKEKKKRIQEENNWRTEGE